jgi:hypothetical protein
VVDLGSGADGHLLRERLRHMHEKHFVGRAGERALFGSVLGARADGVTVLYVHGVGGCGKSALLQRLAEDAATLGRAVVHVDAGVIDRPEEGFAKAADTTATRPGTVLLVDAFELLGSLEGRFWREFLPQLPGDAVVVVASRRPPDPLWRVDLNWREALRVVELLDLPGHEAAALLRARGIPEARHEPLLAFAGGHPLALSLLADQATAQTPPAHALATTHVNEALLSRIVGDLPSPIHRRALEICAHTYRTTEALLRATLPAHAAQATEALFAWLRGLPFIKSGQGGLFPHHIVRKAVDMDLQWRDPQAYEAMHHRIRDHVLDQARTALGPVMRRALMSVTYLHSQGAVMPHYVTWQDEGEVREVAYQPADRQTVLDMATRTEGPDSARIADFWLARQPEAFYLHRIDGSGEPVGFMAWLRLDSLRQEEAAADPVVAVAWEHCRTQAPLRPGEHLALVRFHICPAAYQHPSPVNDLVQMRVLAGWLRSQHLAWSYVVVADREYCGPQMAYLDQHAVPAEPVIGGRPYTLFAHDWRAVPAEMWLDQHVALEIFGAVAPTVAQHHGPLTVLSRTEFDTAVHSALRDWNRADQFRAGPLTRANLTAKPGADPADVLRQLLTEAVDALLEDPRSAHLHKVVATTFFHGVPTQEASAQRLGLPQSTYRRHLKRGVAAICDRLWRTEVYGT